MGEKIWTVSRGPVTANSLDLQKAEAINALIDAPAGILPTALGDQIKPFAIGLFDEFRARLQPNVTATVLRRAIAAFVHSKRYYFASAQPDAMRHDYAGNPLEPVSADDRLIAQTRFLQLKQKNVPVSDEDVVTPAAVLTKTEQIRASLLRRR